MFKKTDSFYQGSITIHQAGNSIHMIVDNPDQSESKTIVQPLFPHKVEEIRESAKTLTKEQFLAQHFNHKAFK